MLKLNKNVATFEGKPHVACLHFHDEPYLVPIAHTHTHTHTIARITNVLFFIFFFASFVIEIMTYVLTHFTILWYRARTIKSIHFVHTNTASVRMCSSIN